MPHKFIAGRRDKIPKQKYRLTNWAKYNEGLRQRGDLTVWISDDALGLWSAPRRTTRGGQSRYSDLAIETCLTLGLVFKQPLRQTQGLMRSIAKMLGIVIAVPDFSTLSRRGDGLTLQTMPRAHSQTGIHLVVDSTGLKGIVTLTGLCLLNHRFGLNEFRCTHRPSATSATAIHLRSSHTRSGFTLASI